LKIFTVWPFAEKVCQLWLYIKFRGMLTSVREEEEWMGGGYKRGVNYDTFSFKLLMII